MLRRWFVLTITCYLATVMANDKINNEKQTSCPPAISIAMAVHRCDTKCIAWCSMPRATPEATGRRHRATTHYILPWRPLGQQSTKQRWKTHLLCWPFWWPSRCAIKIPQVSPNWGGFWLSKKPLNSAIGQALAPILHNRTCLPLILGVFHRQIDRKARVDI